MAIREENVLNISKYKNYLSINGHKPLLRSQFKDLFMQRENFLKEERRDLEKLEMALQYMKELNYVKC